MEAHEWLTWIAFLNAADNAYEENEEDPLEITGVIEWEITDKN
jgi:hypothetical protein